jgi:hypothetical protein
MVEVNAILVATVLFVIGSSVSWLNVRGATIAMVQWIVVSTCLVSTGYLIGLQQ